jgi:hypothetical protein
MTTDGQQRIAPIVDFVGSLSAQICRPPKPSRQKPMDLEAAAQGVGHEQLIKLGRLIVEVELF